MGVAGLGQQVGRHVQAGTAGGTAASAHGQLGHAGDTALGGFADLVVGYPVTDADEHVRTRQAGPDRPVRIPIETRMVVNFVTESFSIRFSVPVQPARRGAKKKTDLSIGLFRIWLPRMDSNHRMPESESGALPLGDGAKRACNCCTFSLENQADLVAMGGLEPPTPAL